MFPPSNASVYRNEAGEPVGWDVPAEPEYDPDALLDRDVDDDEERESDDGNEQHFVMLNGERVRAVFVNVYDVERRYGGPEEGGWWYDTGEPVLSVVVESNEAADRVARELRETYPVTKRRYSVLGGDDWNVAIEKHPARVWPETRPHYE